MSRPPLSYKDAGVDIKAGNTLVEQIKATLGSTRRSGVLGGIGGFGGLFDLKACGFQDPLLVAATDGVGTKLKLAIEFNQHETIGIDLVAMCVNDIVVQGAEPLFFLDYFATGNLDVTRGEAIVRSIARGCEIAGCALIGGETAEMPGMYAGDDYDLAGFCVGAVERDRLIDGSKVTSGDILIGLPSSGLHANGFSLVRKVLQREPGALNEIIDKKPLREWLLVPTRIYVQTVLELIERFEIKGVAHITGGGITENLPRVLPEPLGVEIDCISWQVPEIFRWLQTSGQISDAEMLRTFNCGIGMVLVVPSDQADAIVEALADIDMPGLQIGSVVAPPDQAASRVNYVGQ